MHPQDSRYTAQWLVLPGRDTRHISHNCDAAFAKNSKAKKPSALLLHYNYGAAAVKLWGHKTHILNNLSKKNRPEKPMPAPSGPPKKVHNRTVMLKKRRAALAASLKAAKKSSKSKGKSKADWDEDEVMLFLWGNSKAASNRHLKKSEEKRDGFEKWRRGVAAVA